MEIEEPITSVEPTPEPIPEPTPVPTSTTMTVVIDEAQYNQLMDKANSIEMNLVWVAAVLSALLGAIIINSFWKGWGSGK